MILKTEDAVADVSVRAATSMSVNATLLCSVDLVVVPSTINSDAVGDVSAKIAVELSADVGVDVSFNASLWLVRRAFRYTHARLEFR